MCTQKKQLRSIKSRESLLKAAHTLFIEKGFYNTNTKEIAKLANVSVGNFYNYFQDKKAIYFELLKQYIEGNFLAFNNISQPFLTEADLYAALHAYVHAQMERASAQGNFFSDCAMIAKDYPDLAEFITQQNIRFRTLLEDFLKSQPNIIPKAPYPIMARLLFTMLDSLTMDIISIDDASIRNQYIEALVTLMYDYLFK